MEKLFDALKEKYPGYEIADIRLSAGRRCDPGEIERDIDKLDEQLAYAVRNSVEIDPEKLFAHLAR